MELTEMSPALQQNFCKSAVYSCGLRLPCSDIDALVYGDGITVKIMDRSRRLAIQFKVPTCEKYHPERLVATRFSLLTVLEYTKRLSFVTQEIDWMEFIDRMNRCVHELRRALSQQPASATPVPVMYTVAQEEFT